MDLSLYSLFLITTVMLIMVPGPSAITMAAQGASHDSKHAFFGVLGVAGADALFFALSATGIASLIVASHVMFSVIKWFGVFYLFYLGLSILLSKSGGLQFEVQKKVVSRQKLFLQGLVVQLSNPKALLYFTALLPQFIDPSEPILIQLLIMGFSCFIADMVVYSLFSRLGNRLAQQQLKSWLTTLINKLAGITLLSIGVKVAATEYQH